MSFPSFETGKTIEFTWTGSLAPDSAPVFSVTEPWSATLISSFTSTQSSTTQYSALFTMPTSQGYYVGEWLAQKTVSSSLRNFIDRFVFKVQATTIPT